jgi:4-hydroxy-2-oxoheptanedioate aldolase
MRICGTSNMPSARWETSGNARRPRQTTHQDGQPTVGSMLNSSSQLVAEIMGHAGFDWLIVDLEQSENTLANLQGILQAISTTSAISFVRLPRQGVVFNKRSLDLGAYGIVVPQVESDQRLWKWN